MKQVAIIGLGRFGRSIANTLDRLGYQVLAMDTDSEKIKKVVPSITRAVECDATNETALRAAGIKTCEIAVVAVGSLSTTTRIIMVLKKLKIEHIAARADDSMDKEIMMQIGADQVVLPEHDMGQRLAYSFVFPQVKEFLELTPEIAILELIPYKSMLESSLAELNLPVKYGVRVVAIRNGSEINFQPDDSDIITENDSLFIMGSTKKLRKLQENYV